MKGEWWWYVVVFSTFHFFLQKFIRGQTWWEFEQNSLYDFSTKAQLYLKITINCHSPAPSNELTGN